MIHHGGGHFTGFAAKYVRFPAQHLAIILFANQWNCDPDAMAQGVAGLVDPALLPLPLLPEMPDPDARLTAALANALADMANGTHDSAILLPELRRVITPQTSKTLGGAALPSAGSLRFLVEDNVTASEIEANGLPVVRIRCYRAPNAKRTRYFKFYLTADAKLAGLSCWDQ